MKQSQMLLLHFSKLSCIILLQSNELEFNCEWLAMVLLFMIYELNEVGAPELIHYHYFHLFTFKTAYLLVLSSYHLLIDFHESLSYFIIVTSLMILEEKRSFSPRIQHKTGKWFQVLRMAPRIQKYVQGKKQTIILPCFRILIVCIKLMLILPAANSSSPTTLLWSSLF